ncbi:MAG: phage terminase small subunit P27 family [Paludibaculum sp.]
MGRTPEPTELKLIKGTRDDRVNDQEPKPAAGGVTPPPLTPRARTVWKRLAPDLAAKKVLDRWNVDLFAQYCEAVVVARDAAKDIARRGVLVKGGGEHPTMVKNPAVQVQRDAIATMTTVGAQFGIGAAARSRIVTGEAPKDAKGAEEFFTAGSA